jgi:ABC-type lipoprotein release transport system permease subunit
MTGFLLIAKISWRNLWRNPRGTLLTALALGLGLALLLISSGLLDGGHEQTVADGVQLGPGHVVLQAQGYQDSGDQDLVLTAPEVTSVDEFLRTPRIKRTLRGVSARLLATGLLTSAANASGVSIIGVRPQDERSVSLIPQRTVQGTYLANDSSPSVVIGVELARKLGVKVGSKVVLMTQVIGKSAFADTGKSAFADTGKSALADTGKSAATDTGGESAAAETTETGGEMKSTLLRVTGIFRTGLQPVDAGVVQLPLGVAQTLLGIEDHQVTQIALVLEQENDSVMVANDLRKLLYGKPVEILTWRESMPMLAQILRLDRSFNYVMNVVVLTMVGLGILNTILMRVLERRYEFGVCAALGLRPRQLAAMIIGESLALTSISLGIGLVLGLGINHYFATTGLDFRWIFGHSLPPALVFDPVLYSRLSLSRVTSSTSVVFVMATVISLYPAFRAARTELPDSLKVI